MLYLLPDTCMVKTNPLSHNNARQSDSLEVLWPSLIYDNISKLTDKQIDEQTHRDRHNYQHTLLIWHYFT